MSSPMTHVCRLSADQMVLSRGVTVLTVKPYIVQIIQMLLDTMLSASCRLFIPMVTDD